MDKHARKITTWILAYSSLIVMELGLYTLTYGKGMILLFGVWLLVIACMENNE